MGSKLIKHTIYLVVDVAVHSILFRRNSEGLEPRIPYLRLLIYFSVSPLGVCPRRCRVRQECRDRCQRSAEIKNCIQTRRGFMNYFLSKQKIIYFECDL